MLNLNKKKEIKELDYIPETWDDTDLGDFTYKGRPKETSYSLKFFLISLVVFLLALGILAFSLFKNYSSFSEKKIEFNVIGPASLSSGQSDSFDISVSNKNSIPISEAYVILEYNSGQNTNGDKNPISQKIELGQILSKSFVATKTTVTLFGSEGEVKDLKATLFYKVSGSNADFNKSLDPIKILLKSSPVIINVSSLDEWKKDTENSFLIKVKNNTSSDLKNITVSTRIPNDFVYSSSSQKLYNSNPSWVIENLAANQEFQITMSGKLTGDVGQTDGFTFYVGMPNVNTVNTPPGVDSYNGFDLNLQNIYSQVEKKIKISGQYIDLSILSDSINGENTVKPGDLINLDFSYKNTLNYPIDNVVFTAILSGDIDMQSTNAVMGILDQSQNIATWDKNTISDLSSLSAMGGGKFRLQIRVARKSQIGNINIKIYAKGDRTSESSVSNEQDISIDKTWNVSSN